MKPDPSHAGARYRPEVDGLRALAVIPVIFFHAGFKHFRGGYLGVDVFFVISGYLITTILLSDRRAGRYSIAAFYERRARRILPALLLVVAVCVPLAVAWMLPVELRHFSRSVLSTLAFVPNVFFWLTSSYFHTSAETLPLLHTWSLGVEEQFYLVFPLIVAAAWRYGLRPLAVLLVFLALVSFGLAEWAWRTDRGPAGFFLAPTRAWELMIGSLIAVASIEKPIYQDLSARLADLLSVVGLAGLVLSMAFFDRSTPMPSYYGLVPTLGTGLVIAFTRPGSTVHRLLSLPLVVGVGLISYSAYLWHQPLFAFARLRADSEPSGVAYTALICLAFALAYLSWRFVETPFRNRAVVPRRWLVRFSQFGAATLACVALIGELTHGLVARIPVEDQALASMADTRAAGAYVPARFLALNREFSSGADRKILVVGDSYAQDFVNATLESRRLNGAEIRTSSISWDCQIYLGATIVDDYIEPRFRPKCRTEHTSDALWRRIRQADVVILVGSWRSWAIERLPETIAAMDLRPEQRVLVIGPKNFGKIDVRKLLGVPPAQRIGLSQQPEPEVLQRNRQLRESLPPEIFIDMQDIACDGKGTCPLFTSAGQLISFDGNHLTEAGAEWLGVRLWSRQPLVNLLTTDR